MALAMGLPASGPRPRSIDSNVSPVVLSGRQERSVGLCDLPATRLLTRPDILRTTTHTHAQLQGGNDNNSFILSDPIEGILVINKALDYDHGKREFKIQIQASVSVFGRPGACAAR
jgi:hypothetical protein